MVKSSIYHRLNDKNAILSVFKDQVVVVRPGDTFSAIGTYDLDGCSCLLGLGTTPGSAIVVARISHLPVESAGSNHSENLRRALSASNYDEHYMSLVRRVVSTMMSNHKLFQLPIVFAIFGQYKSEVLLEHLSGGTAKVFSHLNIELRSSLYEVRYLDGIRRSLRESTVVAVQHPTKMPELYIGNCLAHPSDFSGSLASVFDRLGLEQTGHDNGGDGREDDRDNKDEDEGQRRGTKEKTLLRASFLRRNSS
jgi:hypothetical protein